MKYMKQLDSLRAIAVIAVMIHHFIPIPAIRALALGSKGVDLFFVLSGFLITAILLQGKAQIEAQQTTLLACARQFYLRRTIRIFPIYYLTLTVAVLLNVPYFRESALWQFSYLSNMYIARIDSWPDTASHLWSLSVEEQFYLLWPWLIFLLPRNRLLATFVGVIVFAVISRIITVMLFDFSPIARAVSIFWNLDFFAAGSLLALAKTEADGHLDKGLRLFAITGSVLFLGLEAARLLGLNTGFSVVKATLAAALYLLIINTASSGFKGVAGKMLELRPIVYLGKISYGIYLYHNFSPLAVSALAGMVNMTLPRNSVLLFFVYLLFTVSSATFSWFLIERPLNMMKNRIGPSAGAANG